MSIQISVFFDTNFLEARHETGKLQLSSIRLNGEFYKAIRFIKDKSLETQVEICIPEVVWLELREHMRAQFCSDYQSLESNVQTYKKTFGDLCDLQYSFGEYTKENYQEYLSQIESAFFDNSALEIKVIEYPRETQVLEYLVGKAIRKERPFFQANSGKKQYNDAGFKDALIAITIEEYCRGNRCLDFLCAFDDSHHICFYLRITSEEKVKLVKVGQFPSVATLATADLKRYQSVLPKNYRNEYSRALGLFSHGIGIGSFVYLRRIFEKLILDAFATAKAEGKLSEDIFNYDENKHQRRMEEKIKLLRGYLPDTIIDNAGIYGILSVGVLELSEDNCLKYFPVVDTGIQIMLDDYLEKRNRKKRDDTFAKEIAKIKGEVK